MFKEFLFGTEADMVEQGQFLGDHIKNGKVRSRHLLAVGQEPVYSEFQRLRGSWGKGGENQQGKVTLFADLVRLCGFQTAGFVPLPEQRMLVNEQLTRAGASQIRWLMNSGVRRDSHPCVIASLFCPRLPWTGHNASDQGTIPLPHLPGLPDIPGGTCAEGKSRPALAVAF